MAKNMTGIGPLSRTKSQPIPIHRSNRRFDYRGLTSLPAGKMVPLVAFPLLREDKLKMSRFRFNFEMMETVEILMNAVNVNVKAYLVPNLAFDRFNGIDQLNRSYMREPETDGGVVQPFFHNLPTGIIGPGASDNQVLYYLGKHAKPNAAPINWAYNEAYNEIWNFRVTNRSPDIAKRMPFNPQLAKAFWQHQRFAHIVPDFDQATIDGEVPLNVVNGQLPVTGLGTTGTAVAATQVFVDASGKQWPVGTPRILAAEGAANQGVLVATQALGATGAANLPLLFAELAENGITVSLSNIELARKTQAFAALRKQYTGHSDDYIIDMLMNGVTVPEQAWRQPILLADKSTIFGMSKRYSSQADDLTASVVNGGTFIDLAITTPVVPTGGIVMIVCEITPEQLFERQQDPYLFLTSTEQLPEFLRDTLDPEKVEVVENQYVDIDHDQPTGTFGYAPLNHKWNMMPVAIGGKFFRPEVDEEFDEVRQRIWAVETQNPTLSEDFYLCTNMHTKPFVVTDQDPFEVVTRGLISIEGNTVFGNLLIEASDDYAEIMAEAPTDRIDKPAGAEAEAEATS